MMGQDLETNEKASAQAKDKSQSRINALIFGLVFLAVVLAPYPWNTYAPLLFLLPLIYSLFNKMKEKAGAEEIPPDSRLPTSDESYSRPEPYSQRPRDPKDPRKYRPIG